MIILCDFLKDSQFWLEKERQNIIENAGNVPAILLDVFGSTANSFGEVVVEKQSSFDLLNSSKLEVLAELNSDPGHIVSVLTERQASLLDSIADDMNQLQTYMTDLTDGVNQRPEKVEDKASVRQVIEDVQKILKATTNDQGEPTAPGDPLQGLVDDGIIPQEQLDTYQSQNPVRRTRTTIKTIQVVRELRDRYYKIDPSGETRQLSGEDVTGVDIVDDSGNEVEEVFGYPDVQLTPDGQIILTGEGGTQETLTLRPKTQTKRPSNNPNRKRRSFDLKKDEISKEFQFEAWACALFRLVETIQGLIEQIQNKLDDLLAVADISNRLLNQTPLGSAFNFTATVLGDLYSLGNIEEIEIGDRILEFVGISRSLALGGVSPGTNSIRAVCESNKALYCQTTSNYDNIVNFLSSQLDALDLSFGFDIGDLGQEVIDAFNAIASITEDLQNELNKLRELTRKLFGDICAFIDRGIRGTPKSAQEINETVGVILGIIALAPGALLTGISNSVRIAKIITRLTRAGYDAAARALANGQIEKFLAMSINDATHAARVAICLEEAASSTENIGLSRKMSRLANVSKTRADRQTTSQRINEGMHRRFVQRDLGAEIAKIVRDQGWKGIQETRRNA